MTSCIVDEITDNLTLFTFEDFSDDEEVKYKLKLIQPNDKKYKILIEELKIELIKGNGETIYELGILEDGSEYGLDDNELEQSIKTIKRFESDLNIEYNIINIKTSKNKGRSIAEILIREIPMENDPIELRISVIGNVDAGKSTLIGVLNSGKLDNGNGMARNICLRYPHEKDNGRTSSVSQKFIGFSKNNIINNGSRKMTDKEVHKKSTKIISFIDLCGHERYLKTTVFGLNGSVPDYSMIMIGANMGVQRMTREHLGLTLALNIPFYIVITKIDLAPPKILKETISRISRILKSANIRRFPYLIKNEEQAINTTKKMGKGTRIVPIFKVSNVTGEGLNLLKIFLNLIPSQKQWRKRRENDFKFFIDGIFKVPGIGIVVSGAMTSGEVTLINGQGPILMLGPDSTGLFRRVQVKGIHTNGIPVLKVKAGQSASFAIKFLDNKNILKRNQIHKGMVLVDPKTNPVAVTDFEADIVILHHPTTIKENYEPVIHIRTIKQTAKIVKIKAADGSNLLRTGSRGTIHFSFRHYPVYLIEGVPFVFREGRTKGMGRIKRIIYDNK